MKFTYATARSLSSASKVTGGLSLHIPVIIYNGAFIREADTGRTLYSVGFSEEEQKYIGDFLKKAGLFPLVYTCRKGEEKVLWYPSRENDGVAEFLRERFSMESASSGNIRTHKN